MYHRDDIIAAIATPIGEGGIAIVRLSGKSAIKIADAGFSGKQALEDAASHTVHHGWYRDKEKNFIDEIVATVYRSPNSYTGEDVVELSCHGGLFVVNKLLQAVLDNGGRLAEPGEFTKRAFLNGKLDLTQAEAVADLISARSEAAHRSSLTQLKGALSKKVKDLSDNIINLCGLVELELDFAEEGLSVINREQIISKIEAVIKELHTLMGTFSRAKLTKEGVKIVIVGRPNAGKSSLLNALLERDRAIVTNVPGTTRDVIEDQITVNGIMFKIYDTAGLRNSKAKIEKEGIRRSRLQISQADCCLYVVDITAKLGSGEIEEIRQIAVDYKRDKKEFLLILNKSDRDPGSIQSSRIKQNLPMNNSLLLLSAKNKEGISNLIHEIGARFAYSQQYNWDSSYQITNERQLKAVVKALKYMEVALKNVQSFRSGEIVAIDLRTALEAMGTLLGKFTADDILATVFSRFCIGK